MRTGIRRVTVAELHADTEAIIAELPHTEGIEIMSPEGELLAKLAPAQDLTPMQIEEVKRAFLEAETEDPATWMDHDEFMRELDEDERRREAEGR